MFLHYKIDRVLLADGKSALMLLPVSWGRPSDTETVEVDGEQYPAWEECEPMAEGAEAEVEGGEVTMIHFDGGTSFTPGQLLSITLVPTETLPVTLSDDDAEVLDLTN